MRYNNTICESLKVERFINTLKSSNKDGKSSNFCSKTPSEDRGDVQGLIGLARPRLLTVVRPVSETH